MLNEGFWALGLIFAFIPITWLITKFFKPKSIETKFSYPRKEAAIAIAYVFIALTLLAVIFFLWSMSIGKPIGTSDTYNPLKVINEWIVYTALSFLPLGVILRLKLQNVETIGVSRKNWKLSTGIGLLLSMVWLSLGFALTPKSFLNLFTLNSFYAVFYFLAVGFGEELLFRGFLQTRCVAWLGNLKGLVIASVIMAFAHLPQRMFAVGYDLPQALFSVVVLIPISLLMGLLFLRTQNIVGSGVFHTVIDLASML